MAGEVSNKLVLRFEGRPSALAMNRTNYDFVADMLGDETEDWPGHAIELYPTKTAMGGKLVDCIRIRPSAAKPN